MLQVPALRVRRRGRTAAPRGPPPRRPPAAATTLVTLALPRLSCGAGRGQARLRRSRRAPGAPGTQRRGSGRAAVAVAQCGAATRRSGRSRHGRRCSPAARPGASVLRPMMGSAFLCAQLSGHVIVRHDGRIATQRYSLRAPHSAAAQGAAQLTRPRSARCAFLAPCTRRRRHARCICSRQAASTRRPTTDVASQNSGQLQIASQNSGQLSTAADSVWCVHAVSSTAVFARPRARRVS